MPTVYLREVPDPLYRALQRRARRNRRSMNGEAVAILEEALDAERGSEEVIASLRRLRFAIPEGLPPADVIRQGRDARGPHRPRR
jgi:plasmid stability protein